MEQTGESTKKQQDSSLSATVVSANGLLSSRFSIIQPLSAHLLVPIRILF